MKLSIPVALVAVVVLLAGCATGSESSQVKASIPALAQDRGRIYFYRSSALGTGVLPPVTLNGQIVGIAKPRSFFFVDRPSGDYKVKLVGAPFRELSLTLDKGQTRYVRIDLPGGGISSGEIGVVVFEVAAEVAVEAVIMEATHMPLVSGVGVVRVNGGYAYPYPLSVEDPIGEKEIVQCRFTGSYWSNLGYGGEIREAAADGDLEKVKAQIKGNPDLVFLKDTYGWTPLFYAISSGYQDVAELLLADGAEVNATTPEGWTPLHWAAIYDHRDVAALLLANKAEVNATDKSGLIPLHYAAADGYKDVAELLLASNADVNASAKFVGSPLHEAAAHGHKDVAELLLANKADVNARNKMGQTPLHLAAAGGHKDVTDLLLASKADVNAKANGSTPLHMAAINGLKDVAALLLANKAEIDARNKNGQTPLHMAAMGGYKGMPELMGGCKDVAELLLASKADVNARDNMGQTPLHYAVKFGHKDVVKLLRQHGGHE